MTIKANLVKGKIQYKIANAKNIKKFAEEIINFKLFKTSWYMIGSLCELLKKPIPFDDYKIIIAYNENLPVACLVIEKSLLQFFVRPKYRKQGIAKTLFKLAKTEYPQCSKWSARYGEKGSDIFFIKMGIKYNRC